MGCAARMGRPSLPWWTTRPGGGRLSADDARTSLALALYALAAARIFHAPCHRVELHHLPTGEVHAWEHTTATLDRHVRRAEGIAAECRDADERFRAGLPAGQVDEVFPPRPGPGCGWCDFRALCPEGIRGRSGAPAVGRARRRRGFGGPGRLAAQAEPVCPLPRRRRRRRGAPAWSPG